MSRLQPKLKDEIKTSTNALIIDSLSVTSEDLNEVLFRYNGRMKGKVNFNCPETGNNFMSMHFSTQTYSNSLDEALKKCIEDFFNKNFSYTKFEISSKGSICKADYKRIHYIDIQLSEPYKSLIQNLFDASKWNKIFEFPHKA